MSERIKTIIGNELYEKIIEAGLKPNEFDLLKDFVPRSRLNEVTEKLKLAEEQTKDFQNQKDEMTKLVKGNEELTAKFKDLDTNFKATMEQKNTELINISKRFKAENLLLQNGANHVNLLLKELDYSKMTLDNDNLTGFTDQLKTLKENYKDLFVEKQPTNNGKQTNTNTGNTNTLTFDQNDSSIDWGSVDDKL